MYPQGNQFPGGGMPQQGYPMMAPGMGGMGPMPNRFHPQQMPQHMYAPNMVPMNQRMFIQGQPGFPAVRGADPSAFRAPPPTYTPEMAKDFQAKQEKLLKQQQRQLEEQRKQLEQQMKQRQFQEQQKRLKEFSAIGGRKMDADSLIESIVGKPKPAGPGRGHGGAMHGGGMQGGGRPQQAGTVMAAPQDDSFGDFIGGPSSGLQQPPSNVSSSGNTIAPQALPETNTATGENEPPTEATTSHKPQEKKKDLETMMFQCSDLTAPKEAKGFAKKTSIKDVHVAKKKSAAFKESQKARRWEADTNALSQLFTLPDQPNGQEGGAFILPKWITGDAPVPEVYTHVLEAVTKDGAIDTNVLYPILLRSGLSRETLGHIWQMCNKHTPGVLMKEELFCILALISVAQNNISFKSLEVLVRCPQAPIPNLGQDQVSMTTSAPNNAAPAQPVPGTASTDAEFNTSNQVPPPATMATGSGAGDVDDFADFQSAPSGHSASIPSSTSFGDFAAASINTSPQVQSAVTLSTSSQPQPQSGTNTVDLIGQEDKYSAFKEAQPVSTDDFGDFKSTESATKPPTEFANFSQAFDDSSAPTAVSPAGSEPGILGTLTAPPAVNTVTSSANSGSIKLAPVSSAGFADFKTAPSAATDDFADFKTADTNSKPPAGEDKYSALKALIMDKKLYEAKPVETNLDDFMSDSKSETKEETSTADDNAPDEWADFQSGSGDGGKPKKESTEGESDGWANFSQAESSKTSTDIDWSGAFPTASVPHSESTGSGFGAFEKATTPTTPEDPKPAKVSAKPSQSTVDKTKANKMFGRNLIPSVPLAGTGMSPLDVLPPEMPPEMKDDDDELTTSPGFDKFGTFQGGVNYDESGDGISSIPAPYGGLDDFGDLVTNTQQSSRFSRTSFQGTDPKKSADSQSASSLDFTGWKSNNAAKSIFKEDSQSMNSIDFKQSKEGSPAGVDSQSVSSLELATGDNQNKSLSPPDVQSVASLELKAVSSEVDLQLKQQQGREEGMEGGQGGDVASPEGSDGLEDGFGEFSSAGMEPKPEPVRPLDMKELLTEMPRLGDRYGSLMNEPQDSDRPIIEWQKCLEQCAEMITQACNTLNAIPSPNVVQEVINSEQGTEYLQAVTEIYRVVCRIKCAMKGNSVSNQKLADLVLDIESSWGNLTVFIASSHIMPPASSLNFHKAVVRTDDDNAQEKACGVCLLNVDYHGHGATDNSNNKLTYGGRQYHAACANFWVNCVDSTLPALKIPELL